MIIGKLNQSIFNELLKDLKEADKKLTKNEKKRQSACTYDNDQSEGHGAAPLTIIRFDESEIAIYENLLKSVEAKLNAEIQQLEKHIKAMQKEMKGN